ncbi:diguanylate cyclase/phosphodiesterase [Chromohalobacter marismortui]|uniref:Diguanylate cyclase/phosphodiesterase n=1 Tax=Chromohalobacter marismortui TaxID=42055 RepID=A0A4R7NS61_9GAMM|nr:MULTISPECIES: bifunctional diguanylate cyclase/phosphodiesterase [Chromohalobacter]MCI0511257.1 EAL and GGDEF domain-containing protein [Chromohalobacter sp.]MCI0593926.1 EAL and GGDEF domain-containing protein [Chromohalobacter sp.]TDU23727.1 diguanylate cyclase/phosphodiesterase [Chromohalobacter marismortui]
MSHSSSTTCITETTDEALSTIVREGRIDVHFQPIVAIRSGRVFAYEALSRGPQDTVYASPLTMFEEAREQSLLAPLDAVCRQRAITAWAGEGLDELLFINVSPEVLLDPQHRSGETLRLLKRLNIPPHRLVIELTEQSPGIDPDLMADAVRHYQSMGFTIALDDLGEGYASLRLWSQIRPDFVKLDRHFVSELDHDHVKRRFVRAFLDVAHGMGSRVIAEGVEREEELDCLHALGADYYQGWLFARPSPAPKKQRADLDARLVRLAARQESPLQECVARHVCKSHPALAMTVSVAEASERFSAAPDVGAMAVVDAQATPIGVLTREAVMALVGKRFGFDLHGREPVTKVMRVAPLCVEVTEPLDQVSRKVTGRDSDQRAEPFVVTQRGRYVGMGLIVALLQQITEQKVAIARQANPLTQLPGNAPVRAALDAFVEAQQPFVACYLDLDHFKPFNDRFGYALGDHVLLDVADTLNEAAGPDDFVGHVGGDDFVLLLQPRAQLQHFLAALQKAFLARVEARLPATVVEEGGFTALDRFGHKRFFLLPRLSVAALCVSSGLAPKSFGDCWGPLKQSAKRAANGRLVVRMH